MKFSILNFRKLLDLFNKDKKNVANEFDKFDGTRRISINNKLTHSESIKDQPQVIYANQIIIEQL
tara:strand:+ start:1241 stop:1435 length:195 start_codon:yes stop_codon:yes gene_type:complete